MVILTVINILLYSYTRQQDIRIGVLVANRRRRETEGVIGHFLNTVIIRTQISPSMPSRQLLRQVREVTLAAYAHQELPFEKLAEVLEEEKNVDRSSLFQVLCNFQKTIPGFPETLGISFAPLRLERPQEMSDVAFTAFNLVFNIRESSTALTATVNWKKDVFGVSWIASMRTSISTILRRMILESSWAVSDIAADLDV
jgi:non-ribosomal peptide synthetase component F